MRIHFGQPVHGTDGPFGEVADVVIDPIDRIVTHVVVEPKHSHQQARLVPLWLVWERDGHLMVDLDLRHLRELRLVAETEYIRLDEPIDLGEDWDVGIETVLAAPMWPSTDEVYSTDYLNEHVTVAYDRIPKGECEIRRASSIITYDGHTVGHVEGLLVDGDDVVAMVTTRGGVGLGHRRIIPMDAVAEVFNDQVRLSITRKAFNGLRVNDKIFDSSNAGFSWPGDGPQR